MISIFFMVYRAHEEAFNNAVNLSGESPYTIYKQPVNFLHICNYSLKDFQYDKGNIAWSAWHMEKC